MKQIKEAAERSPVLWRGLFALAIVITEAVVLLVWPAAFKLDVIASAAALAIATVLWAVAFWDWLAILGYVPEVAPFAEARLPKWVPGRFQVWGPPLALVLGFLIGHVFWHGK